MGKEGMTLEKMESEWDLRFGEILSPPTEFRWSVINHLSPHLKLIEEPDAPARVVSRENVTQQKI